MGIGSARIRGYCGNLPGVALRSTPGYTHTAALQPVVYMDPLVRIEWSYGDRHGEDSRFQRCGLASPTHCQPPFTLVLLSRQSRD